MLSEDSSIVQVRCQCNLIKSVIKSLRPDVWILTFPLILFSACRAEADIEKKMWILQATRILELVGYTLSLLSIALSLFILSHFR